ncbi:alpha/beta hydrolase [Lysobacter sp. S4-A87]|uniref:alpha/beta fold hydrolase n=1 Tax=Lysobacter sp. S4-A87 TaxID=2925843 RepID=UPI001F53BD98|nr:alpha/beta hydrolase [Lysobacter sp. S4-A87]UNK49849.1 alpha/beta hydrolase [Lysobacter sp. S4-A87]
MHTPALLPMLLSASLDPVAVDASPAHANNIVVVHGAFADSSGWRKAAEILEGQGFSVSLVQIPITSMADDVAATQRVLDMQDGPSVLVAHSYGGMVITEAGARPDVAALVYVAAFQPETGESLLKLATETPPESRAIVATRDDKFLYLDHAAFAADFAADVPKEEAAFMARSQVFASKQAFTAPAGKPAWRSKKSWAIVTTKDRTINPELQRRMAERAGSVVTEIESSHAVFLSQPGKVAEVIANAARQSGA